MKIASLKVSPNDDFAYLVFDISIPEIEYENTTCIDYIDGSLCVFTYGSIEEHISLGILL